MTKKHGIGGACAQKTVLYDETSGILMTNVFLLVGVVYVSL